MRSQGFTLFFKLYFYTLFDGCIICNTVSVKKKKTNILNMHIHCDLIYFLLIYIFIIYIYNQDECGACHKPAITVILYIIMITILYLIIQKQTLF